MQRGKYKFHRDRSREVLDQFTKTMGVSPFPKNITDAKRYAKELVARRREAAGQENAAEVEAVLEAGLAWAEVESLHGKGGSHYITIPDRETYDIIDSINVDNIDFRHLRYPYKSFAIVLPDDVRESEFEGNTAMIASCVITGDYRRGERWLKVVASPDVSKGDMTTAYVFSFPMIEVEELGLKAAIDSVHDRSAHINSVFKPSSLEEDRLIYRVIGFAIKLCVFCQAFPEALKPGPGFTEYVSVVKTKKGKKRTEKKKVNRPESMFVIPSEYRRAGKAHWRVPHFRTLHDPRYRREDADGNLLEVGEEGFVRMVPVKGSMVRGKIHHIDKDTEVAWM